MSEAAGTYTFLFTDIVASSTRWEEQPEAMLETIRWHHEVVRRAVESHAGKVFKSLGDGQAAVFAGPHWAIRAALAAQRELIQKPEIGVKIALHTGFATLVEGDFMGPGVNRVARLVDLAQAGQVLASGATIHLSRDNLEGIETRYLGEFGLLGHERPEEIHQVWGEGLPHEFSPLAAQANRPTHNLTPLERPFVGRKKELAELKVLLEMEDTHLITILGFGGIGKTTLSRQLGWELVSAYPDGVWFVECEGLDSKDAILEAIADAASALGEAGKTLDCLVEFFGKQKSLIILDCFERGVLHASVIDDLLKSCPRLQVLVTSRRLLGLAWEQEYALGGMVGAKKALSQDATQLFWDAAGRSQPSLKPTKEDQQAVERLCAALEHIPLAIVICAGRMRYASASQILEQVQTGLLESVRTSSGLDGRHSGLRKVIQTTFDLLDVHDRRVAARLAVFEGGFLMTDAVAVLAAVDESPRAQLSDSIARLRDHSLLSTEIVGAAVRFRILDSVREFLGEIADPNEMARLGLVHAEHYATVAHSVRNEDSSRLHVEVRNLHRGAQTAKAVSPSLLAHYASILARPLLEAGLTTEFVDLAESALPSADPALRKELLGLLGTHHRRLSRPAEAREAWTKRAELCLVNGDVEGYSDSLSDLANLAVEQSDFDEVERLCELFDQVEGASAIMEGVFCSLRAQVAVARGRHDEAADLCRLALLPLEAEPESPSASYLWRSTAEILRACGLFEKGLEVIENLVQRGLRDTTPQAVRIGLLEKALLQEAKGEPALAMRQLLAAELVPMERQNRHRQRIQAMKRALVERHGEEIFDDIPTACAGNWRQKVKELTVASRSVV